MARGRAHEPKRQSAGDGAGEDGPSSSQNGEATWRKLWWLVAPLAVLVAYRSASSFELVGDARFLIADNAFVKSTSHFRETLLRNYFWSSSGQIIPYWRPVTKLSWLAEWQWFGSWGGGYAWVNVAWHALGTLGVSVLARQVGLGRLAALLGSLVFALHPVAIEPVSLVMARSDVVATAASIWAVVCWRKWRAGGPIARARSWAALHVAFVVIALGSKEVSIVLPTVLAFWAVLEGDLRPERRRRLLTTLPAVTLAAVYFLVRRALLERQAPGLSATALDLDPLRVVTGLAWYVRAGFPLLPESPVREVPIAEAKSATVLGASLLTLLLGGLVAAWSARRRELALAALLGWVVLGLAPVLLTRDIAVPTAPDRYSLADRWLYYVLGPLVLAYLATLSSLWRDLGSRWGASRKQGAPQSALGDGERQKLHRGVARGGVVLGVCAVSFWAVVLVARSEADRAELASDLAMLDNEDRVFYQRIPERFRTQWDHCRHEQRVLIKALMQGRPADADERAKGALERCPDDADVGLYVLDAWVQLGRFDSAEPLARKLIASPPRDLRNHGRLAFLAGATLLERGDTASAAPLFEKAVKLGQASCRSFIALAEKAKGKGRVVEASEHLETAYRCGGSRDPSLRVAAATWLVDAKEHERAHRVLDGLSGAALSPDQAAQVSALRRVLDGAALQR